MKVELALDESDIKAAIALHLNGLDLGYFSEESVRIKCQPMYDYTDRPTGSYIVSATATEI